VPDLPSVLKQEPTRLETVLLFLFGCGITAYSFAIARHADLTAVHEPEVRRLVRHAYGGLLFELIGLLVLAAALLPYRFQEKYLFATQPPNRLMVYLVVPWLLLVLLGIGSDTSRALQAAAAPGR
jgi:hypothetical protein